LLLEYGHLLTAGRRLESTIRAQVDRRVREQRDLELRLLGLVATADAYGAELDVARLQDQIGVDDGSLKRALVRLVDEHLITERDGALSGLHELRSRYIMSAIHDVPPPTLNGTVRRVIDLIDASALQAFLTRLLLDRAVTDDVVIEAVALRLNKRADAASLAASLHALRLVSFRRMAEEWRNVIIEEDVPPTSVGVIAHLVLNGGGSDIFPEAIQRATARIERLRQADLRAPLIERIAAQIPFALAQAPDPVTAATVLAALAEVGTKVEIGAQSLAGLAGGASLVELRSVLEAAYAVAPDLAGAVVDQLGGSTELLARLERERPWVRDAHDGVDDQGRRIAAAEYAYVAEGHQPKAHDAVVELARDLSAFAPMAEVIVCRAVDATGGTAGFGGVPLADKAIDRLNLPSRAAIAWNRARGRAALAAVAAPTETAHVIGASEIVAQAARVMRQVGDTWARVQRPRQQLLSDVTGLANAARSLLPPPISIEAAGPLEEGELPMSDPVSFIGTMIPNNLIPRLFDGDHVAPLIPNLIREVDQLSDAQRWRLLREPPLPEIASLRNTLVDLHAFVAELTIGDRFSDVALKKARKKGLVAAANVARQRADGRMQRVSDSVVRALDAAGYQAWVVRRAGQPESHRWPSDDFLILVDIDSIYHWQSSLMMIVDICRPLLHDRVDFFMAPVRRERVVGSFGVRVITNVFPDDAISQWPDMPLPLLEERVGATCSRGLSALIEVSGIIASVHREEVHDDEAAVVDAAMDQANEALRMINELIEEPGHPLLIEIQGALLELAQAVEDEAAALVSGAPVANGVAASVIAGLKGESNDVFNTYAGVVAACVEYDVDPVNAWDLFQELLHG
jgi:hypothetical protein